MYIKMQYPSNTTLKFIPNYYSNLQIIFFHSSSTKPRSLSYPQTPDWQTWRLGSISKLSNQNFNNYIHYFSLLFDCGVCSERWACGAGSGPLSVSGCEAIRLGSLQLRPLPLYYSQSHLRPIPSNATAQSPSKVIAHSTKVTALLDQTRGANWTRTSGDRYQSYFRSSMTKLPPLSWSISFNPQLIKYWKWFQEICQRNV